MTFSTLGVLNATQTMTGQAATVAAQPVAPTQVSTPPVVKQSTPQPATSNAVTAGTVKPASTTAIPANPPVTSQPAQPRPTAPKSVKQPATGPQSAVATSTATQPVASTPQESTSVPVVKPTATPVVTPTPEYPVLAQDKPVNIGVDTTQVNLTAAQIDSHFNATIENLDENDQDDNPKANQVKQPIDKAGAINLTVKAHTYHTANGGGKAVTGHQAAHVAFEHEIDFKHNFSMTGALGIGSQTAGGADSVGVIFAPGDPTTATDGHSGGQLGLGGLKQAFGFVYDEHYNDNYHDPSKQPYIGWRTTDAAGNLQAVASENDWQIASTAGLNDRTKQPMNDFTMDYDASTKLLTVVFGNATFTKQIVDIDTGYALSIAASTGGDWNNYAARIDKFSYTPKTIPVAIKLVDSAEANALLNQVNVNVTANIGDAISVFSTQAAADRAVALGEVNPNLVAVLPTDSAGNNYVVDFDSPVTTGNHGVAHNIAGTPNQDVADATYYTYTVTDDSQQLMTVPVRRAFKTVVTPVDAQTKQPIEGATAVTVIAVTGKATLVTLPGYTPTKVILMAPTTGEQVAHNELLIDQTKVATDDTSTTTMAVPLAHYYIVTGQTTAGQTVTNKVTVGTGQSVTAALNKQALQTATGTAIDQTAYQWSEVAPAAVGDSTDADHPQVVTSLLVPTASTLKALAQQAQANQTAADEHKQAAQDLFDNFVKIDGLSADQKAAAQTSLTAIKDMYTKLSANNATARADFTTALAATTPAARYQAAQTGGAALQTTTDLLQQLQTALTTLTTKKQAAAASLVTLEAQSQVYGEPLLSPDVNFGPDFGTLTAAQIDGIKQSGNFQYLDANQQVVTPKVVGQYTIGLSAQGRAYLKQLMPNNPNAGLFVASLLTITPKTVVADLQDAKVTYGDTPTFNGNLNEPDDHLQSTDFEIVDTATGQVVTSHDLQVNGHYTVCYTADKQTALQQNGDYHFSKFATAKLTVIPKTVTVVAQAHGKTYGTVADPTLDFVAPVGLANADIPADLGVTLSREAGEHAGTYQITGVATNPNYKVTVTPATFTIAKRPVTVTIAAAESVYGDAQPSFQLTTAAKDVLVAGDALAALGTIQYTPASGHDVGIYQVTGTATGADYLVQINAGQLTIKPRPITVTLGQAFKMYGDDSNMMPMPMVSPADLKYGDGSSDLKVQLTREPGEAAGRYTITGVGKNKNYLITIREGSLTILKKPLTVKFADQQKVYGEPDPLPTLEPVTDLVAGDTQADLKLTVDPMTATAVGQHPIQGIVDNPNYRITVTPGVLTITKRPITVKLADQTQVYGDPDQAFDVQTPVASLQGDDAVNALGLTIKRDAGQQVGQYAIHATAADNTNYQVTVQAGRLTIIPRPVTVTATDLSKVYGATDPKLSQTVTTGTVLTADDLGVTLTRVPGEQAGQYVIKAAAPATNPNYVVTVKPGTLTITPQQLTVKLADQQKVYGDADPQMSFTITAGHLAAGDTAAMLGLQLAAHDQTVGHYQLAGNQSIDASANYQVTIIPGTLTITKRPITVTVADQSKIYGAADPKFSGQLSAGALTQNDSQASLGLAFSRTPGETAGHYTIMGTASSHDYAVKVVPGNLLIQPVAANLKLTDMAIVYGELPKLTTVFKWGNRTWQLTPSDFEVVDTSQQSVALSALQAGGDYRIQLTAAMQAKLAADSNIQLTQVLPGQLTVAKRPLTIKIADQTQYTNQALAPMQVTLTQGRLRPTDSLAALKLAYTLPAPQAVGTYTVNATASNPNYAVQVVAGQLKRLGQVVDATGNRTTTEKDAAGRVVKVIKQWTDHTTTVYTNQPVTGQQQVIELVGQHMVDQYTLTPERSVARLSDGTGTITTVTMTPTGLTFSHLAVSQSRPSASPMMKPKPIPNQQLTSNKQLTTNAQPAAKPAPDQLATKPVVQAKPVQSTPNTPGIANAAVPQPTASVTPAVTRIPVVTGVSKTVLPAALSMQRVQAKPVISTDAQVASQLETTGPAPIQPDKAVVPATELPQTNQKSDRYLTMIGTLLLTILVGAFKRKQH
ncbi:MBG domain-containing protein [Lactiplantibacillus daowaiensis]|uniref:MBG domain-containing protein n=1 Tax=Lactiplantibacillus daowaiensis TaxID=2559918 RepID=UPI00148586B8|nr:MBG domain-containing protein [Lactiplantibacillus daowaiensis]